MKNEFFFDFTIAGFKDIIAPGSYMLIAVAYMPYLNS
jgi:hypothetical protein